METSPQEVLIKYTVKHANGQVLRPVHTKRLRLRHPLTPMVDKNAFYIELHRKTQTQTLGVNRPLDQFQFLLFLAINAFVQVLTGAMKFQGVVTLAASTRIEAAEVDKEAYNRFQNV